jgi:hypothetical protein
MKSKKRLFLWLFSSVLGIAWGVFAHSYWLLDDSRWAGYRLVAVVAGIVLAASVFHFIGLTDLLCPYWKAYDKRHRFWLILASAGMGAWVFFVGTYAWDRPSRYLVPFLPHHRLEVVAKVEQSGEQDTSLVLTYFSTSLGEVSFSQVDYRGWERRDKYTLILTSWNVNHLIWEGRVGEKISMDFMIGNFSGPGELIFKWEDGKEEKVELARGKVHYSRRFNVPWFASRLALFALGTFLFGVLAAFVYVFVVKYFSAWYRWVEDQFTQDAISKKEIAWLGGIWIFSLALRGFYLESLPPYVDEYAHLLAAKKLLLGASLSEVYQRSLWITTMPVFLAFRLFGPSIWSARLAGVIVNSVAIFPLYWLMRRINRWVAVASILLYATNPWLIAISRNVREYAYYPVYFYGIVAVMVVLLQKFFAEKWKINRLQTFFGVLFLSLPLLYGMVIDAQSTFKVVLLAYGLFAIFASWKIFEFLPHPLWRFLCSFSVLIPAIGVMFWKFGDLFTPLSADYLYRLKIFLTPVARQWYFERTLLVISLLWLASVGFAFVFRRQTFVPLFGSSLFTLYFVGLVFFFARYSRPRYLSFIQIWYIPFLATGIYAFWGYMRISLRRAQALLLAALMFVVSVNPIHILRPAFWKPLGLEIYLEGNVAYITEERHYELAPAHSFLMEHVGQGDALVATMYASYAQFLGRPGFSAVRRYRGESIEEIFDFVRQYPSGWIVLDELRKPKELPLEDITQDKISIQYLGKFGDVHIWRWEKR